MYDYGLPLQAHQVAVRLHERGSVRRGLAENVADAGRRYGFQFEVLSDWRLEAPLPSGLKHALLIIVSDGVFEEKLARRALALLDRYAVVSIAFEYPDLATMLSYRDSIEAYKRLSADRINFLRPCPTPSGRYSVPDAKIVDNSICDSVRVKYRPDLISASRPALGPEQVDFFREASSVFEEYGLYHRSLSDGYFACRAPGRDGFFVTATKTYKNSLDFNRIVYVDRYDEASGTLSYAGPFLPSSDSVEAAILFQSDPDVISVMHTHASERFTRNAEYRDRIRVGVEPYGEAPLGHKIVAALREVDDGFIIMEDHGEVFASPVYGLPRILCEKIGYEAMVPAA